jgi:hypothetical protein
VCPFRVEWHCPVEASQILTLSSFLALATPPPSLYGLVKRLPSQAAPTVQNMRVPSNAPSLFLQKEPSPRTHSLALNLSLSLSRSLSLPLALSLSHTLTHSLSHTHTHTHTHTYKAKAQVAAANLQPATHDWASILSDAVVGCKNSEASDINAL